MSDFDDKLTTSRSFYTPSHVTKISTQTFCKSDFNLLSPTSCDLTLPPNHNTKKSCGEYYKKYDHDELPVKDYASYTIANKARGDSEGILLTNSELDNSEKKALHSHDVSTDVSIKSLDSHLQLFKSTVLHIFDNFYASMKDFELYKKKFYEILANNSEYSLPEMEDFVKDIIQQTMSSETSVAKDSLSSESHDKDQDSNLTGGESEITTSTSGRLLENLHSVVEAYKNDNYGTDSNENASRGRSQTNGVLNVYLLNDAPFVGIKMNNRNLLSEVNLKDPISSAESKVASAEDLKKLAAKRIQMDQYVKQQHENLPDRDIPVKVSPAKKNLHLNEDFICSEHDQSFMSKICNYLCKKFRRHHF